MQLRVDVKRLYLEGAGYVLLIECNGVVLLYCIRGITKTANGNGYAQELNIKVSILISQSDLLMLSSVKNRRPHMGGRGYFILCGCNV